MSLAAHQGLMPRGGSNRRNFQYIHCPPYAMRPTILSIKAETEWGRCPKSDAYLVVVAFVLLR
jgi:hypothetical protein